MQATPILFDALASDRKKQENEAVLSGYKSSDFLWFGNSVPEKLTARCILCNCVIQRKREDVINNGFGAMSENCPECRRRAVNVFDQKFWDYYVKLKLWEYDFFADQFDEFFASHIAPNDVRKIFKIRSDELKSHLALTLKNRAAIDQALLFLEGLARRSGQKRKLETRVASYDGKIWIDLCDDRWRAIALDANGWEIVERPPILFRRYKHMLPMEIDRSGTREDFDDFLSLMNFSSKEDRMLYCAFLFQGFYPDIDRPILMPTGPQGSAKTTLCSAARMLIDPSSTPYFLMDKEGNELPQKILHNYIPTFDNCNYVSQEISDMLCQASSGLGFSKRKLFTDMDDVVYTARRALILNGISAPSMAPDLLDRTLMISMERISEEMRKEKREIEGKVNYLLPKVRCFILDTLCAAMKEPNERKGPTPRLADFARISDDCLTRIGYGPGEFLRIYSAATHEIAEQAVQSDPLAAMLLEFLEDKEGWEGSASELYRILEEKAGKTTTHAPGWPKTPSWLSDALLGRLKPGLRILGWNVCRNRSGNKRTISILKVGEGLKGW